VDSVRVALLKILCDITTSLFVWEKCLINFKQRLLVVDEEVQQMIPVLVCKVNGLNSVFSKLGEP